MAGRSQTCANKSKVFTILFKGGSKLSEITDLIMLGILCEQCGEYIDEEIPGMPRKCKGCK